MEYPIRKNTPPYLNKTMVIEEDKRIDTKVGFRQVFTNLLGFIKKLDNSSINEISTCSDNRRRLHLCGNTEDL